MNIVSATGAVVEQMSIDEAYLDFSAICQAEDADASLFLSVPMAQHLKKRISTERNLTATIGIAANKLLSKIASDHQKPDGLTVISETDKARFLRPLPVRALFGVGKVTEQVLNQAGILTVADLSIIAGICARWSAPSVLENCGNLPVAKKRSSAALGDDSRALAERNVSSDTTTGRCSAPVCARKLGTFPAG